MDCEKTGKIIRTLRLSSGMTQRELADKLSVSDKAVSKWERGAGCPDISLIDSLARELDISPQTLLNGELFENEKEKGSMKRSKFFVCPLCSSIVLATGEQSVSCCSRPLVPLVPQKAAPDEALKVEAVEDDWFVTGDLPMEKENFVSFIAFLCGDRAELIRLYPEWGLEARIPRRAHGTLLWYSAACGLRFRYI